MEEFDYLSEYGGYTTSEDLLLEVQNAHKVTQNMRNISDISELSTYVNHLIFLHVHRLGTGIVPMEKYSVHIPKLGKMLRGHSSFIKKLQAEKRSVYFSKRGNRDIVFGRTQTLMDAYYSGVDILLKASSTNLNVIEILIKTIKDIPVEMEEI